MFLPHALLFANTMRMTKAAEMMNEEPDKFPTKKMKLAILDYRSSHSTKPMSSIYGYLQQFVCLLFSIHLYRYFHYCPRFVFYQVTMRKKTKGRKRTYYLTNLLLPLATTPYHCYYRCYYSETPRQWPMVVPVHLSADQMICYCVSHSLPFFCFDFAPLVVYSHTRLLCI